MIEIQSSQNKIIKTIKSLHKTSGRKKEKLYFIEGIKIFDEIKEKKEIQYIVVSSQFAKNYSEIMDNLSTYIENIYVTSDEIFKDISDTETPQGILAVLTIPQYDLESILHIENPFFVLGDCIQDPGNIGTIIRTADAAGANAVILNKGSVDIYNPKALRSMMGSHFHIPIFYVESLEDFIIELKQRDINVFGSYLQTNHYHYQMNYTEGTAIVIGNESKGISPSVLNAVDYFIKIPMLGKAESLNVGVATGVLLYEVVRQRLLC